MSQLPDMPSADEPLPVITLMRDHQHGLWATVPLEDEDFFTSSLQDDGIPFTTAGAGSPLYAGPGHVTLIFGSEHPLGIQQVLEGCEYEVILGPDALLPEHIYPPPLDKLLSIGMPPFQEIEMDERAPELGSEHVPELVRMALDGSLHNGSMESEIVWAPVHAWRALAALRAGEAAAPLAGLLARIDMEHMDESVATELPNVFAALGEASMEPLTRYLADDGRGEWSRSTATDSLTAVARSHPALRDECVARLAAQLRKYSDQDGNLNASIIWNLSQLKAMDAIPLIQEAFTAGKVDESHCGDWEDIQIEMGLKASREHPRKPNNLTELGAKLRAIDQANRKLDALLDGEFEPVTEPYIAPPKTGRNEPCPCGSGRKYKKCCGRG